MISVNDFKPGITFQLDGNLYVVLTAQHSKQGRGQANVKAKVKDLRSGATTIKSFTGGDKVQKAHIETIAMNYLYNDGTSAILMDEVTYEQVEIPLKRLEWELNFLVEGAKVKVRKFENEILDIEIPLNIELEVAEAFDAVKGNTTTNPQKKVTLTTGFELEVPMFIKQGDIIIVSTEEGKYIGKGKK
ncbi:elongation factor P [Mesomycoplasma moatsii]|uniref:elongation factor P n=1 Tax=Mesomycoplasma moatsii TaxID=171287 RepID=UPI000420CABB